VLLRFMLRLSRASWSWSYGSFIIST